MFFDLVQRDSARRTAMDISNRMIQKVFEGNVVLGKVGSVVNFANELGAELKAATKAFRIDESAVIQGVDEFNFDVFPEAARDNAALRSSMYGLAYAAARALDNDGRLSDADIQIQLDRLGAGYASKEKFYGAMESFQKDLETAYRNEYDTLSEFWKQINPDIPVPYEYQTLERYIPEEIQNQQAKDASWRT